MPDKGKLYFTSSLPRAGKSTYADNWVRDKSAERPRAVIGGDDFRTAIHGMSYLPEAEAFVFAAIDVAAKALLARGFDVLIDETCTTKATLLRYLRIDLDATPVWIDTPAEECKRRAIATGKAYLLGPIERMSVQLEKLKKNYDAIHAKLSDYVRMRLTHDNHV